MWRQTLLIPLKVRYIRYIWSRVYTKGNLALAVITNCLLLISSEIEINETNNGIELNINEKKNSIDLVFTADEVNETNMLKVFKSLDKLIASEMPSLEIKSNGVELILNFKIVNETIAKKSYKTYE